MHITKAGNGFTVISEMRHSQPAALTMLLSGFPDVKSAIEVIILQADEIVVKPVEIKQLAEMVRERLLIQRSANQPSKARVSEDTPSLRCPRCQRLVDACKGEPFTEPPCSRG